MAAIFFAACVAAGCGRTPEPPPPPPPEVDVARPIVRQVTEWDEFTGRLAAIDTVEVRPRVSGFLESVHFKEGQIVKKGDLLFVIDPRPFRAVLAAADADVAGAQTRLELARNDAQRSENLVKTGAVSAEDFDRRSKAAVEAQASLDTACGSAIHQSSYNPDADFDRDGDGTVRIWNTRPLHERWRDRAGRQPEESASR